MDVDEPVSLAPYDPDWPRQFEEEASRLARALSTTALGIAHIGSTAVPGLAAKPIVDVLLGVVDPLSIEIVGQLAPLGYEDCGTVGDRRYLRLRGAQGAFNVQVVEYEGRLWQEDLAFRDFLRANPTAARRYADAKYAAVRRAPTLLRYSEEKRQTIEILLREAWTEGRSSKS